MGTNYYAKAKTCKCCGHTPEDFHIGKSSAGWTFTFRAHPEIRSYKQLLEYLSDKQIVDEYRREVSLRKFMRLVERKRKGPHCMAIYEKSDECCPNDSFLDEEGHSFTDREFS